MSAVPPPLPVRPDPPSDLLQHLDALRGSCLHWPEAINGHAYATDAHDLAAQVCAVVTSQDTSWMPYLSLGLLGGAMLAGAAYAASGVVTFLVGLIGEGGRWLVHQIRKRRTA